MPCSKPKYSSTRNLLIKARKLRTNKSTKKSALRLRKIRCVNSFYQLFTCGHNNDLSMMKIERVKSSGINRISL